MNRYNYKRKLKAFYNRNRKYRRDALIALMVGALIAATGYIQYLDFIARGVIN